MKILLPFILLPACTFPPLLDSEPSGVAQLGLINVATAGDNSGETSAEANKDIDVAPKASVLSPN